ncbi:MAG: patatin-like phospholipase family protein [Motiliproteus sp.]
MQISSSKKMVPVLAGGGTRLSAHIGVLAAIEELGIEFSNLVGVSGGSVVGALYAKGYSVPECRKIAEDTDFSQFLSSSLWTLLRTGGLSTGDRFERWVEDKLGGATFAELDYNFHVVATDVRSGLPVIFDRDRTPDMPVSKAVRFSMSIPILFSFQEYKDYLLVDGSILSEDALQRDWSKDGSPVICFRLRSQQDAAKVKRLPLFPLKSYLGLLIRTFMTTMSREYVNESFWHSTVIIQGGYISPTEFKLTRQEKGILYKSGYDTVRRILPMKLASKEARLGTTEKLQRVNEDL